MTSPGPTRHTPAGLGLGAPWQIGIPIPAILTQLRPHWWIDWRWEAMGDPAYVPTIWSAAIWQRDRAGIQAHMARWPGRLWLLNNEPERADQADMDPAAAATMATEIAGLGAYWAGHGVAVGRAGLAWLDAYLDAGGPIPPIWHVHIYGAITPGQWDGIWADWAGWMDDRGVTRPTVVSETNGWIGDMDSQRAVLAHVATVLQDGSGPVAAAWFATHWPDWRTGHPALMDAGGRLTRVGQRFAEIQAAP